MSVQSENLDAIVAYFNRIPAKNPNASAVRMSFLAWYKTVGFFRKHLDEKVLEEAQRREIQYNVANGDKPAVKDAGLTAEEADYYANSASVDCTGLTPGQCKVRLAEVSKLSAIQAKPAPGSVLTLQYGVLKEGITGDGVKRWQYALRIEPTGNFDATTIAATKKFQSEHGIKPDGAVGPASWTAALGTGSATINPNSALASADAAKKVSATSTLVVANVLKNNR
jgi:peptidoglycan hydrolase-like protein with peptidoglycan-binding domain